MRAFLLLLACAAAPAFAVEQKDIKVAEKWAVVGVISGTDPRGKDIGVAVLRNNVTKHTYTLAIGDAVPNEFGFVLKAVQNRNVVIANGEKRVTLGFAEAPIPVQTTADAGFGLGASEGGEGVDSIDRESRTARFIDNYYRGLGESPIEIFKGDREEALEAESDGANGREGLKLPVRRFGGFKEDAARSRFDVYRNDGGYAETGSAEATTDDGDGDGFVVNFSDGFQEDDQPQDAGGREPPVDDGN